MAPPIGSASSFQGQAMAAGDCQASALAPVGQVDEIITVHSVGYDGDGRNETKGEALIELDNGSVQV
jgi:hypothetical protein